MYVPLSALVSLCRMGCLTHCFIACVASVALAGNIGQYHTIDKADLSKTLKVIVTNNNFHTDSNVRFLSYFSTSFNQGIAPGDFIWPPFTVAGGVSAQEAPRRSPQIFKEFLDDKGMLAKFEPIPNSNGLTSAVYQATTIQNSAFGVMEGQKIELLLLQTNSKIPTNLLTIRNVNRYSVALADIAFDIMNNKELVTRIQTFLADS
jgi:hypothetical protein